MHPHEEEEMNYFHDSEASCLRAWARRGQDEDPARCPCGGSGYILTERDYEVPCSFHHKEEPVVGSIAPLSFLPPSDPNDPIPF